MSEPRHVNMDQVAELFMLTRGVRDVVEVCAEWIQHGPLGELIGSYHAPEDEDLTLPEPITERFADLNKMLDKSCLDSVELETCRQALSELRRVYCSVAHFDAKSKLQTGTVSLLTKKFVADNAQAISSPG